MRKLLIALLLCLVASAPLQAQTIIRGQTDAGATKTVLVDTTGAIVTSGSGGATATAANQTLQITQETAVNTVLGTVTASPTANTIADRLKTINTTLGTPVLPTGASTAAKQPALGTAAALSTDVLTVGQVPTTTAAAGITPVVTSAVASNLVVCGAACNVYGFAVTTGATAGYVLLFDATSAPVDGAVTPSWCMPIASTTGFDVNWRSAPRRMATGATLVFSTTGCFTKTASATAFITGGAK